LYTDDGFPIDVLSRFIGGALAVGDAAVGMGIGVDAINAVRTTRPNNPQRRLDWLQVAKELLQQPDSEIGPLLLKE